MSSKILSVAMVIGALTACSDQSVNEEEVADPVRTDAVATTMAVLSDADILRVCRGGASFRNGTAVDRIKAVPTGDMVRLSYTRDDGRSFDYDCMIEGNQVRYRMLDEAGPNTGPGTWSGRGSTTTFKIYPTEIEFTDQFSDGSVETDRVEI